MIYGATFVFIAHLYASLFADKGNKMILLFCCWFDVCFVIYIRYAHTDRKKENPFTEEQTARLRQFNAYTIAPIRANGLSFIFLFNVIYTRPKFRETTTALPTTVILISHFVFVYIKVSINQCVRT